MTRGLLFYLSEIFLLINFAMLIPVNLKIPTLTIKKHKA